MAKENILIQFGNKVREERLKKENFSGETG